MTSGVAEKTGSAVNREVAFSGIGLPPLLRYLNRVGSGLASLGLLIPGLGADELMKAASRRTGLSDFGGGPFREGLRRLVESLENDACLTTLGRITARSYIMQNLVNRLEMTAYINEHPEITDEEIRRPLFIIGLPRTGTTILHSLLDRDPANRSPLSWECLMPSPPPRPESYETDWRRGHIQKQFDRLYRLVPGFEAVHPMSAVMPQECVAIWTNEFMSPQFFVQFNVSSYQSWLDNRDMRPVYRAHRQFLQFLQSGGVSGERWLLKSPGHLHLIDDLLEVYPDAAIVHTHRDPVRVVASITSLTCMLRGISSNAVDPRAVAMNQLDWWEDLLQRSVDQRERHCDKKEQFFDIKMEEITADPLGSVDRIYGHFGFNLAPGIREDMGRYMNENQRDKHGSHTYRPEDFGIDPDEARKRFSGYIDYFNLRA